MVISHTHFTPLKLIVYYLRFKWKMLECNVNSK